MADSWMVEGFIGKVGHYKGTVAVDQLRIVERIRKQRKAINQGSKSSQERRLPPIAVEDGAVGARIGEVPMCALALQGLIRYHDDTTRCDQDRNPGRRHIGAGSLPSAGGAIFAARESDLPV